MAQIPVIKQPSLAESFNHCVPYDKKGSWWTAFTDAATLHITEDMVLIYTVGKLEVHPHAENFRPQACVTKPQRGLKAEVVDRLVFLAKNVLNRQQVHTSCSVHLPTCHVYYEDI